MSNAHNKPQIYKKVNTSYLEFFSEVYAATGPVALSADLVAMMSRNANLCGRVATHRRGAQILADIFDRRDMGANPQLAC
ncbi:hypothetical protein [Albirhodobacter sp. R86504]|uniref:hypothetical protein n=1 Tax=Albirhodobacter sp. R86504 TaxID=3093848 RepID=UPI00366D5D86